MLVDESADDFLQIDGHPPQYNPDVLLEIVLMTLKELTVSKELTSAHRLVSKMFNLIATPLIYGWTTSNSVVCLASRNVICHRGLS